MRVVLASIRYPPSPGGAESHVAALARGLVARGHDVEVHTSDLHTEYPFVRRSLPAEVDGVRVVRHPARRLLGSWTTMPAMPKALRAAASGADVVHAHSYGYHQTVAAASAAKATRKPFVLTPHYHPPWSMEGGGARWMLRRVYDRTLGARTVRAADRVIFVSSGERDVMRAHHDVPDAKAVVIPNGFDAERFRAPPSRHEFRPRVGLTDANRIVLYAGRLASNKGLHHLVPAFATVAKEREDVHLVLAGEDQGHRETLQRSAEARGVGKRVVFAGHLPDAWYVEALAAADVLVLPSEWEAFGIVLAEAAAMGVACVATAVGGAPDVVLHGRTGILVPYGDERALAGALASLLDDPVRRRALGQTARERAFRHFTWDAVVDRTVAEYEAVARR